MALNIPDFPNPYDSSNPLENVYGWISFIALDLFSGTGSFVLNVNPSEETWQNQPLTQIQMQFGGRLVTPSGEVLENNFPTLAELMTNEEFSSAYNTIGAIIYQHLLAHPRLPGATITPTPE